MGAKVPRVKKRGYNRESYNKNMRRSPLEQFEIIPLLPRRRGSFDISFTNSSRERVIVCGVMIGLGYRVFGMEGGRLVPTRYQVVREGVQSLVLSMIAQTIGPKGKAFYPVLFTLFVYISLCNRRGRVPYGFTATSHLVVTMTLGRGIWFGKRVVGVRMHGAKLRALRLPAGSPFAMTLFMVGIEALRFVSTFVSLSVRLFANMMSGHVLLKVIAGFAWSMMAAGGLLWVAHFVPRIVLYRLMFLEAGVALLQAYVFTRRTAIYLSDMVHGGH